MCVSRAGALWSPSCRLAAPGMINMAMLTVDARSAPVPGFGVNSLSTLAGSKHSLGTFALASRAPSGGKGRCRLAAIFQRL